jgi:hypothetical protein
MATEFNSSPLTILGQQDSSTPAPQPSSGFFDPGGFGYENLGPRLFNTLGNLGERFGQFAGEQLYGTGITADGKPTGFPIDRPTVAGDIATLPGNTLRALDFFAGPVFDTIPGAKDYLTGKSGVEFQQQERENKENIRNAALNAQAAQELSNLMQQAELNSPQANFLTARAQGNLTPEQINEANAFAASMGTTFDPNLGYSRTPFLEFQTPTINSILDLPAGVGNFGMKTDPQGRMISQGDDRSAFDQASRERLARLEQRDLLPGETFTERDTRLADARTGGAERGGQMSFEEARKFIPKGAKETTKSHNARIKAFQAQQNSTINQLKEQYEQLRVQGQVLNNERIAALAAKYQQTEPQRYREVLQVAQAMLKDGLLEDQVQVAMYVIEEMGGKPSDIFDPFRPDSGGGDGGASTYTPEQETKIESFMSANGLGREEALKLLRDSGRI